MRISRNYSTSNWNALLLDSDDSPDWPNGIDIIQDRFISRYFEHLDKIVSSHTSGFVVMSVCCMLIETMVQFQLGVNESSDVPIYAGNQRRVFSDFFMKSDSFKSDFNRVNICNRFTTDFRNGLLHQSQTKNKSQIRICQSKMVTKVDPSNLRKGLIIDRNRFYKALRAEFDSYIERLKASDTNFLNESLKENAKLKMDLICSH
jgi:hypothetical protein